MYLLLHLLILAHQSSALIVESILTAACDILYIVLEVVEFAARCVDVEFTAKFVNYLVIFGVDLVLLFERNMPSCLILLYELLHFVLCIFGFIFEYCFHLLDDAAFCCEISMFCAASIDVCGIACLEEFVACSEEIVPKLVAQFLRYHAY